MHRWFAAFLSLPLLFAQETPAPSIEKPLPRLIIPDKLQFSKKDFRNATRLPDLGRQFVLRGRMAPLERECAIPLLRMPVGPESAGPMPRFPVKSADRIPNHVPAPACDDSRAELR
jgi:hypothetical protein